MSQPTSYRENTASQDAPAPAEASGSVLGISFHSILWPIVLSLIVLGVIGYFTFDLPTFRAMLSDLNPWWLGAAAVTVVLRVLFGGWRLNYFSHGRLGFANANRAQIVWDFFSNVTPSTIGGGPFAAGYISRTHGLPLGEATSIMLFSMLLDQILFAIQIPLILICSMFLEIIPRSLGTLGTWSFTLYFLGFMVWVCIFGYSTLFRPQLLEKLVARVFRLKMLRRFQERALGVMEQLQDRARILRTQPKRFYVKGFILTVIPWLNRYLVAVFIIWSVYPDLDQVLIFLRTIALNLGSVALPTPGGAGGLEGLYALLLGPPLVPQALVAPTLLMWRLLAYYIFIAMGAFITMHQVQRTIRLKKRDRAAEAASNDSARNGASILHPSESERFHAP